jgi:hypothetical protein
MKKGFLLIFLLAGFQGALASTQQHSNPKPMNEGLPSDAVLLTQSIYPYSSEAVTGANHRQSYQALVRIVDYQLSWHFNYKNPMTNNRYCGRNDSCGRNPQKSRALLEHNCATVYKVWTPVEWDYSVRDAIGKSRRAFADMALYCKPRTMKDRHLLRLQRQCRERSLPECFDKAYLDHLDQVTPTTYVDLNRPNCVSL